MPMNRTPRRAAGFSLLLGLGAAGDFPRCTPAAPRKVRQGLERRRRAAIMVDQGSEGARADILGADQAQPVEALLIGEGSAAQPFCPILPSVPSSSRLMFSLCFHQSRAARTKATPAVPGAPRSHRTIGDAALATRAESDE